jgi:hypothetical protein
MIKVGNKNYITEYEELQIGMNLDYCGQTYKNEIKDVNFGGRSFVFKKANNSLDQIELYTALPQGDNYDFVPYILEAQNG